MLHMLQYYIVIFHNIMVFTEENLDLFQKYILKNLTNSKLLNGGVF